MRVATIWLILLCIGSTLSAEWPARVFAPYAYLGDNTPMDVNGCRRSCGQLRFVLAFIVADKQGNPTWDGYRSLKDDQLDTRLSELRQAGGDVAVSFGGAGSVELAMAHKDVAELEATYAKVIDAHHFTWADFDIEGKTLDDAETNHRRNAAIVKLQANHAGLAVSFTLPADPDGMREPSLKLLTDAQKAGVHVTRVNVMTMDFGDHYSHDKKLSDVCIATAQKSHEQCNAINRNWSIGLCPMLGVNDVKTEVFTREDADRLLAWAQQTAWVSGLSFWSANYDSKADWAYTKLFQQFH